MFVIRNDKIVEPQLETRAAAVNAIARILANVDRQRLGYQGIVQLDDLEPADVGYYREQAVIAIQALEAGNNGRGRYAM